MIKKTLIFIAILYFIFSFRYSSTNCQLSNINSQLSTNKEGITTVVIDAGHGGKDPGCLGHKAKEKDIALAIALALGRDIEKNCPDVKVVYTRRDDNFIELFQRAEIANKNKADLFISIHCNSSPSPTAYGVETFVMGLNKSQANLNVAKKENSSILLEDDYKKNYGGFDPNSPEAYIIFSLYQNAYLDQSLNLASKIEKQIGNAGRFARGVKQAGFLVLYKTAMTGMLVEAGFLTNSNEEEFLMSEGGQNKIAVSIFKAFKEYKNEREGKKEKIEYVNNDSEKVKEKNNNVKVDSGKVNVNNEKETNSKHSPVVVFKIQFATSSVKKNMNSSQFKGLSDIEFYFENGLYKYTIGNEKELEDAKKILNKIKEKGFKDAFIIVFSDGKRIKSIAEALNLQKRLSGQ